MKNQISVHFHTDVQKTFLGSTPLALLQLCEVCDTYWKILMTYVNSIASISVEYLTSKSCLDTYFVFLDLVHSRDRNWGIRHSSQQIPASSEPSCGLRSRRDHRASSIMQPRGCARPGCRVKYDVTHVTRARQRRPSEPHGPRELAARASLPAPGESRRRERARRPRFSPGLARVIS